MTEPQHCPECERVFRWGDDGDSALVDAQGEQWLSCRENAFWKLTFHMQTAHPDAGFLCPRRDESAMGIMQKGKDWWGRRDGHRACSYCGSLSPAEFFAAVDAGAEIGPTDKSYKAYVALPNPQAGQTIEIGSTSGPAYDAAGQPSLPDLTFMEKMSGRYRRPRMGTAGATVSAKFYFQHLSTEEQQRFIELVNAHTMKIGMPGYFYRLPFFCAPVPAEAPPTG